MEHLPNCLLQNIFLFLDPADFFSTIPCINKSFLSTILSEYTYRTYLSNYFNIHKPKSYSFNYSQAKSIIHQFVCKNNLEELKFEGFATNGGVDEDGDIWWVDNLFQPNANSYCSRESKSNINCAGVLKEAVIDPEQENSLNNMKNEIARVLRNSGNLRRILIRDILATEGPLTQMEELLFIELWQHAPNIFDDQFSEDRRERTRELRRFTKYYQKLMDMKPKLRSYKVSTHDDLLLVKALDHDAIQSSSYLALVNGVIFSRAGEFTCPVETFLLFISDEYIPVESEEFNLYDNLNELSEVIHLANHDTRVPKLVRNEEQEDLYYAEFEYTHNRLKPLVWCKFKTSGENFRLSLKNRFSGVYFYAKLVKPDNRMAEMGDQHDDTNIDATYAGLRGKVINLSYSISE